MKKSKNPNRPNKLSKFLLLLFPPIFFFSYHPVITLGATESMNLELSLPEIWLAIFFIVSLPNLKNLYKFYSLKPLLFVMLIPIYFASSLIWSENRLRTLLTTGLCFLLVFAGLNIFYYLKQNQKLRLSLTKSLLTSAVIVSGFCWLQCILDIAGVSRDTTLLCEGCVYQTFGFPHPSGFAIEPQFMGNLLLAPTLLCYYLFTKAHKRQFIITAATIFLSATLFLTLSRGAIYAFLIALVVMLILIRKKPISVKAIACVFALFALTLTTFGTFSAISPTSDTFISGVTKAIHQLTLGKIDLRPELTKDTTTATTTENTTPEGSAQFSGYIAESTDTRLSLNSLAIKTWASSPQYMFIGAGLGSAGLAMHQTFPDQIGPKEIVQNEYLSLLLETGLLGLSLVARTVIVTVIYFIKQKTFDKNTLFCSTTLAFALTLLFFSGLPNALHIYLFPLLFFNYYLGAKNNFLVANKV